MIIPLDKRALLFLLLTLSSMSADADLQQEMDSMFGTMTNYTAPTAHLVQRRGVITGGSLVARNGITNTNLVFFRTAFVQRRLRGNRSVRRQLQLYQLQPVRATAAEYRRQRLLPVNVATFI